MILLNSGTWRDAYIPTTLWRRFAAADFTHFLSGKELGGCSREVLGIAADVFNESFTAAIDDQCARHGKLFTRFVRTNLPFPSQIGNCAMEMKEL
jgi:hypothetical protein